MKEVYTLQSTYDGIVLVICDKACTVKECYNYIEYLEHKYKKPITNLSVVIIGDDVDLKYQFKPVAFERIRRITGYLTGNTGTWNSSKLAEEKDRVKHDATLEMEKL